MKAPYSEVVCNEYAAQESESMNPISLFGFLTSRSLGRNKSKLGELWGYIFPEVS